MSVTRTGPIEIAMINGPIGVSMIGDQIGLRTDYMTYVIGTDGQNRRFYDRHTGNDHLYAANPFMSVKKGAVQIDCTAVTLQGSNLHVEFGGPAVSAQVSVKAESTHLVLNLLSVSDPSITSVTLAYLQLDLTNTLGLTLAHCEGSDFAAAVVSLNVCTRSVPSGDSAHSILSAEADARVSLAAGKIAILGCEPAQLLSRLSLLETTYGLPHPMLGGTWARDSQEVKSSYLFVDLTSDNAPKMIEYALQGGFRYIVISDPTWVAANGHGRYLVNRAAFPGGPNDSDHNDLQEVSNKVHAAGLKLGMHLIYGVVDLDSKLVKPLVHPGFCMVPGLTRTLAADLHAGQSYSLVPTTTSPATSYPTGSSSDPGDGFLSGNQRPHPQNAPKLQGYGLRIDNERIGDKDIDYAVNYKIGYTDIQTSPPYGFTFDPPVTIKAAHSAGALIENFAEFTYDIKGATYPYYYLPDLTGPLWDEMTTRMAHIMKKFEFDYIYPDGYDGSGPLAALPDDRVPKWYLAALLISKLYSAVEATSHPVLFEHGLFGGELSTDYAWHIFSRGGGTDQYRNSAPPYEPFPSAIHPVNSQTVIDYVRTTSLPGNTPLLAARDLQPFEFGWFGFFVSDKYVDATRPREIEYVWCKALAYGASMSLETSEAELEGNRRRDEVLDLIKIWEDWRLTGNFPQAVRDQMQDPLKEFTLRRKQNNQWEVKPITYDEHQVDPVVSGSDHWTLSNPHGAQHAWLVIEAGPTEVNNPALRVNNAPSIQFQTLKPSCYLEYSAEGELRAFDANGIKQTVSVHPGGPVLLQPGANDIVFTCGQGQGAKVTFATVGPPLQ